MPTATSSRRKTNGRSRREPSSDGIEDAAPSQGAAEDDVEEEQPSRSARTVKKEKKGGRSAPRPTVDDDDEDDEDAAGEGGEGHTDYDRIDVNNFPDQPLTKDTAPNIKGILSDWDMIRKINTTSAKGALESIGVSMADLMDEDQATKSLAELDGVMREVLDLQEEMELNKAAVNEIYQTLSSGGTIESPIEVYEKAVKTKINEYRAKTSRQKYAKQQEYQNFHESIYEAQHRGGNIPPITDFIPREDGDASDDEDDLEIGGVTQVYTCPISLTPLVKPMTTKTCGHSFSEQAIRAFLKDSHGAAKKCPASGCNQMITMSDLEHNTNLEKKVKLAERRARQQEESDDDDDEVIE